MITPDRVIQSARGALERPFRNHHEAALAEPAPAASDAWWVGDERWFSADFAPREGNRLTPLIDGEHALKAMYEAIAAARVSVYLSAWFASPPMPMVRQDGQPEPTRMTVLPGRARKPLPPEAPGGPDSLRALLARKAEDVDVRVLLWPGSIAGKFRAGVVRRVQRAFLQANPRLRCRVDTRRHPRHCQHQKALVVDGRVAFVGGLDVTDFDIDRWDTQAHRWRAGLNWHDCHMRIEGPLVADVTRNFTQRWNANAPHDPAPEGPPPPPVTDGVAGQIVRTLPRRVYPFAHRGVYGIYHAYHDAIQSAERFIYLESQYLWSPEITEALCDALRRPRTGAFALVLVLPGHPNVGKADTDKHVKELLEADAGRGVLGVYTLYTWTHRQHRKRLAYQPIYVHAKVGVVDDTWCTVGSANLNGRGMATDAEMNVITTDSAVARDLRVGLWAEHLACPPQEITAADPVEVLTGRWRAAAQANAVRLDQKTEGLPCALMPYPLGKVDADWGWGELEMGLLDR